MPKLTELMDEFLTQRGGDLDASERATLRGLMSAVGGAGCTEIRRMTVAQYDALPGKDPSVLYLAGSGSMVLPSFSAPVFALLQSGDAASFRAELGLGEAAVLDLGTTPGTVAAGDHTHTLEALGAAASEHTHVSADITDATGDAEANKLVKWEDYGPDVLYINGQPAYRVLYDLWEGYNLSINGFPNLSVNAGPYAVDVDFAGEASWVAQDDPKPQWPHQVTDWRISGDWEGQYVPTLTVTAGPNRGVIPGLNLGTAATKDVGTAEGTVAAGNHTHTYEDVGAASLIHQHISDDILDATGDAVDGKLVKWGQDRSVLSVNGSLLPHVSEYLGRPVWSDGILTVRREAGPPFYWSVQGLDPYLWLGLDDAQWPDAVSGWFYEDQEADPQPSHPVVVTFPLNVRIPGLGLGEAATKDVGATTGTVAAGDHTHTPEDVGAAPANHTHTPSSIGAEVFGQLGSYIAKDLGMTNTGELVINSGGHYGDLYLAGCTRLTELNCSFNSLEALDVSGCTNLSLLSCQLNQLSSLQLAGCTTLTELTCFGNQLETLDLSDCPALTGVLSCGSNQLSTLDLRPCPSLTEVQCAYNNLENLDVSNCPLLAVLDCSFNLLETLDVSGCTNLSYLNCAGNQLTALDVSGLLFFELSCFNNHLTTLNVTGCTNMGYLNCTGNQLTSLDVSGNTALGVLYCAANLLASLNITGCTGLSEIDAYCPDAPVPISNANFLSILATLVATNLNDGVLHIGPGPFVLGTSDELTLASRGWSLSINTTL